MGLFDTYLPNRIARCPICDAELKSWQGKEGPCGLFLWELGKRHPVRQQIDDEDVAWSGDELKRFVLPEQFRIYSYDCRTHHPIVANCRCVDGVWSEFEIQS